MCVCERDYVCEDEFDFYSFVKATFCKGLLF